MQRGRMGRLGDCTGCRVTRVRREERRALAGQRAQDARAPPGTRSPRSQPSPPRIPPLPDVTCGADCCSGDRRGGVGQGPKNSAPQTAPGVLHTWHPGRAICSELTASRARGVGLERYDNSAWEEDAFESTETMKSVNQCLWCSYCVPSVPSSCWARELHHLFCCVYCIINSQFER